MDMISATLSFYYLHNSLYFNRPPPPQILAMVRRMSPYSEIVVDQGVVLPSIEMNPTFPADDDLKGLIYQFPRAFMVHHIASQAMSLIRCDSPSLQNSEVTDATDATSTSSWPSMETFAAHLVSGMSISRATLVVSSIYMDRLRTALSVNARGTASTPYRILLASLIVSHKCHHDVRIKNKAWLKCTRGSGYVGFGFTLREVNSMERELLSSLDYNTLIGKQDIVNFLLPFLKAKETNVEIKASNIHKNLIPLVQRSEGHLPRRLGNDLNDVFIAATTLQMLSRQHQGGIHRAASSLQSTASSSPLQTLSLPTPLGTNSDKVRPSQRLSKIRGRIPFTSGKSSKGKEIVRKRQYEVDSIAEKEGLSAGQLKSGKNIEYLTRATCE